MISEHSLFRGAAILTSAGIISRILGFFFRIFLSHAFGEESVGLYQLTFPFYALCLSLSTSGLQTAVSRISAEKTALGHKEEAERVLKTALCLAAAISIFEVLIIQRHASFIAGSLLGDKRCRDLLLILSYALPWAAVHSCINGCSLGLGNTKLPAVSQLVEQSVRIVTVIMIWLIMQTCGIPTSILPAAAGAAAGELIAAAFSVHGFKRLTCRQKKTFSRTYKASSLSQIFSPLRELLAFSLPLTANRTALTLLQSIEAASIPASLIRYGMTSSDAIRTYGVLTGMALPCILFPSAVTGSISTVLLPAVSAASTAGKQHSALSVLRKAVVSCFLLGLSCCLFFLIFGRSIGRFLFHSEDAGRFIITLAWICPFLYTNHALLSALNGYGMAGSAFFINMTGLLIRITGVFLAIPGFGMQGYLWALLAGQLAVSALSSAVLFRKQNKSEKGMRPRSKDLHKVQV